MRTTIVDHVMSTTEVEEQKWTYEHLYNLLPPNNEKQRPHWDSYRIGVSAARVREIEFSIKTEPKGMVLRGSVLSVRRVVCQGWVPSYREVI